VYAYYPKTRCGHSRGRPILMDQTAQPVADGVPDLQVKHDPKRQRAMVEYGPTAVVRS
jgi:hypothetical protein